MRDVGSSPACLCELEMKVERPQYQQQSGFGSRDVTVTAPNDSLSEAIASAGSRPKARHRPLGPLLATWNRTKQRLGRTVRECHDDDDATLALMSPIYAGSAWLPICGRQTLGASILGGRCVCASRWCFTCYAITFFIFTYLPLVIVKWQALWVCMAVRRRRRRLLLLPPPSAS